MGVIQKKKKKTGSGILSYMSAQAGANQVIALEASSMAEKIEIVTHTSPFRKTHHSMVTDTALDNRWSKLPTAAGRTRTSRTVYGLCEVWWRIKKSKNKCYRLVKWILSYRNLLV